jgi:hypothetical protein
MKPRGKKSKTVKILTATSGQTTQTARKPGRSKGLGVITGKACSKAKDRRRARAFLLTLSYTECIRTVIAENPDAIFEWPAQLCSISIYPGGPEISGRFTSARPAWIDAAKRVIENTGVAATRKAVRKANLLRARRLELGDLQKAA